MWLQDILDSIWKPQMPTPLLVPYVKVGVSLKTIEEVDKHFRKGTVEWYEAAYKIIEFDKGYESRIKGAADRVLGGKPRYLRIEAQTNIPWYMIGCIHNMECSCNFRGVLHNGELIVGTGERTTLVPAGRGPFDTWESAALDAVKSLSIFRQSQWSIGVILQQCEIFNGKGYLLYHPKENSPYDWGQTSINDGTGRYVADGKWSETADANGQVGAAAIIRQLELWGDLALPATVSAT